MRYGVCSKVSLGMRLPGIAAYGFTAAQHHHGTTASTTKHKRRRSIQANRTVCRIVLEHVRHVVGWDEWVVHRYDLRAIARGQHPVCAQLCKVMTALGRF